MAIVSFKLEIIDTNKTIHNYCRSIMKDQDASEQSNKVNLLDTNPLKRVLEIIKEKADSLTVGLNYTFHFNDADYECSLKPGVLLACFSEIQSWYIFQIKKHKVVPINNAVTIESLARQYSLTNQEKTIVELLINGYETNQISEKLYISPNIVKYHISNIYRKTNVANRISLIQKLK